MSRTVSADVTLGTTEISAGNVRRLFSQLFANEDGQNARSFDALAKYPDNRQTASQA